jgi:hypothetical protein
MALGVPSGTKSRFPRSAFSRSFTIALISDSPIEGCLNAGARWHKVSRMAIGVVKKTYTVSVLCRANHRSTVRDWKAVKRVGRYLLKTIDYRLYFPSTGQPILASYADADFAGDPKDRMSTSGHIIFFGGGPVNWRSKIVSSGRRLSQEYVAAAECTADVKGTRQILAEMNLPQASPTVLYEDNQSCHAIIDSERTSGRVKHIDTRYHFIRKYREIGIIRGQWCPGKEMVADILTKALPRTDYEFQAGADPYCKQGKHACHNTSPFTYTICSNKRKCRNNKVKIQCFPNFRFETCSISPL